MNKLNIPKKKADKFQDVDFVHKMTPFQLKTLVKNLWENLGELANATDNLYPEISTVIDKMRDGATWSPKALKQRYRYTESDGKIIQFDTKDNKFRIMDTDQSVTEADSMTQKELNQHFKKLAKGKLR